MELISAECYYTKNIKPYLSRFDQPQNQQQLYNGILQRLDHRYSSRLSAAAYFISKLHHLQMEMARQFPANPTQQRKKYQLLSEELLLRRQRHRPG